MVPKTLRVPSPEELEEFSKLEKLKTPPSELDDSCAYTFRVRNSFWPGCLCWILNAPSAQSSDNVWIRLNSEWIEGKVCGSPRLGMTRKVCRALQASDHRILIPEQKEGLFWKVTYTDGKHQLRRYFAPLNGDIKPDTEDVRQLLEAEGWLEPAQL